MGHELSIASYLIDAGADVNIKDIGNWVPLLYEIPIWVHELEIRGNAAIYQEHKDLIRADINARDNAGDTLLSLAINYGHYQIIRLLVEAGVQVDLEYKDCFKIISLAAFGARWCGITVLKMLLRAAHDNDLVQLLQYSPVMDGFIRYDKDIMNLIGKYLLLQNPETHNKLC
ncbi:hypothetical protein LAZ67_6000036 [Cordylochernes scorpioides]|uniref:Uncharacterized protein n=1 Tax=Cordylochernes scorpioides TaxID=51811 RepID=A0ABY6KI51_9ARAC|nr:hypothetical protein LAZ67_6000036 [Cordylochernes scorpioides]